MNTTRLRPWIGLSFAVLLAMLPPRALAVDAAQLPEEKRTKLNLYVTAPEAAALKAKLGPKALFVDIRTKAEVMFTGAPTIADANVPYVDLPDIGLAFDDKRGAYRLEPNSDFGAELARRVAEKGLGKDDVIILMCRSGDRSSRAINQQLADSGYTRVYSVVDGFEGDLSSDGRRTVNGWKNAGLPWTYKMDRSKVYLPK
ncbi:rhodanese-like domain-containing protein [Rhizobacter sp. Root404]|jgi:rhodanese-related sulfurtransferase|uniref:rhodanese-like domain-containing protein n=1 Tax=Rhizobacter sp. Root404 TaxID=1736528 RepID=UPI0006F8BD78|nr:rhodanese-like domain-containing protein [Rhizobacter sp. Root404]KQW36470.1 sulfurtransferase [Rhizobacter sp. Root404]